MRLVPVVGKGVGAGCRCVVGCMWGKGGKDRANEGGYSQTGWADWAGGPLDGGGRSDSGGGYALG